MYNLELRRGGDEVSNLQNHQTETLQSAVDTLRHHQLIFRAPLNPRVQLNNTRLRNANLLFFNSVLRDSRLAKASQTIFDNLVVVDGIFVVDA